MWNMTEDARYKIYRIGAHVTWWGAFAWTATLTWVNLVRPVTVAPTLFQRVSGLFIILLMGCAIALGSALSRMRLARTISDVFQTGMRLASESHKELASQIIASVHEEKEDAR